MSGKQKAQVGFRNLPKQGKLSRRVHVGIAGWANPPALKLSRPTGTSHLEHYASHLSCVEINSSFYRSHLPKTYLRWRSMTPQNFRFAVKMPKSITHESELRGTVREVRKFIRTLEPMIPKLAVILVQLPPSLKFQRGLVSNFFKSIPTIEGVRVVCEPRHESWADPKADALLALLNVSRVAADPARFPGAEIPGGAPDFAYYRWHGSPRIYHSSYTKAQLRELATAIKVGHRRTWCIFDNTARYAAWENALELTKIL